ncbi:MAG: hypothetical protein FWG88_08155 [Oscillospiraceae bacterium]|nr:hypothetical protein [Oscillospiraceae bacterium]
MLHGDYAIYREELQAPEPFILGDGSGLVTVGFYVREIKGYIRLDIEWSFDYFDDNPTIYNHDIAIASLVLAEAAYDLKRIENTLNTLGFTDRFTHHEYNKNNVFNCAHAFAYSRSEDIVAVVLRGTPYAPRSYTEWIGNLLLGFTYAANTVETNLRSYARAIEATENTKFFIVGHSRGAAVANIIAPRLTDNKLLVYVYTFATAYATPFVSDIENRNIFNWKNLDDWLVVDFPLFSSKHGKAYEFKPSNHPDVLTKYKSLTGKDYVARGNPHAPEAYMAYLLAEKTRTADLYAQGLIGFH